MTRVLVTIGPASEDPETISKLSSKTSLFRLNGSHNSVIWHRDVVKKIREIAPNAFILLDIPGAKPRTANAEKINITEGELVIFGAFDEVTQHKVVSLTKPLPTTNLDTSKQFSVNDGQYLFDITECGRDYVMGRSRRSFDLLPKKGLNIPGSVYDNQLQLEICREFLATAQDLDVDGYGLSFIQNSDILKAIKELAPDKVLVSKIENTEGLANAQDIIINSDCVMIDRGDLAAEIGFERLFNAVEEITISTKKYGRPLIMATENLESMLARDTPSKSEVMSLAHALAIGTDCIMLSEETATAKNAFYIFSWLQKFLRNIQINVHDHDTIIESGRYQAIWKLIKDEVDIPVLLMSKSGYALYNFMALRPQKGVTVVTDNPKIEKVAKLFSAHIKVISTSLDERVPIETIQDVIAKNKNTVFRENDHIAAVYVSKYVRNPRANSVSLFHRDDF